MPDLSSERAANFILDAGTFLLASGAHCGRVRTNLERMASAWGLDIDLNPTFTGLVVTVKKTDGDNKALTLFKTAPAHNVHLSVLTDISQLSWKIFDEGKNIEWAEDQLKSIKSKKSYSALSVAVAVGISCGGLCLFSFGDMYNALLAFAGAFVGLLVRIWFARKNFNPMICVVLAAFVTTLITASGSIFDIGENPEAAMATGVLYLIPGVPLINSVIDLIEGYLPSAINRSLFAGFTLLCIAAGMTLCITLLGINNFS